MDHIVEVLASERKSRHITLEEISHETYISTSALSNFFSGKTDCPNFLNLKRLCEYFGYVLTVKPKDPPPPPPKDPALEKEQADRIQDLRSTVKLWRRISMTMAALLIIVVVWYIVDLRSGSIGFYRY